MSSRKHLVSICSFMLGACIVLGGSSVSIAQDAGQETAKNPVAVPFSLALGKQKFEENCARCHGETGYGTDQGPPLMHAYYKSSHHSNQAFYRAIVQGSPQHHWSFGDMPAVPSLKKSQEIEQVIAYVRWMQKQAGVE